MKTDPETLSAILAEMRDPENDFLTNNDLRDLADRIEAAAKRERDTAAPGNAAAMREALEHAREAVRYAVAARAFPERLNAEIDSALSAPARNCDLFAHLYDARQAFYREHAGILPENEADIERAFCDWLFAPAEGGAE